MPNLSIWETESFYAPQDLIIVGAGLLGLWAALAVKEKKPNTRITLVDRNPAPLGASSRNAGFACFGSPTELLHDAELLGTDDMLSVAEMRFKGLEKIRQHFSDSQINWDPCGGYEAINKNYEHWDVLEDKIQWLNQQLAGITRKKETFLDAGNQMGKLGLQNFDTLIQNSLEAGLHSGKLLQALIQKVQSAGITLLSGIDIKGWEKESDSIHLYTNSHIKLQTRQVLFTVNAFTQELLPELHITPARGQILVTTPIENLSMKGTFHFDEGFYYWRNLDYRILIGGARNQAFEEEATSELACTDTIKEALIRFLKEHISQQYSFEIDYHWTGIMGFTPDKKPLITEISDGIFAAIACNGMGVALSPIVAENAANMLIAHF